MLLGGHGFKMEGMPTALILTPMVHIIVLRDWANKRIIHIAMRMDALMVAIRRRGKPYIPIALRGERPIPWPASTFVRMHMCGKLGMRVDRKDGTVATQ
jgi:hypothetical protein